MFDLTHHKYVFSTWVVFHIFVFFLGRSDLHISGQEGGCFMGCTILFYLLWKESLMVNLGQLNFERRFELGGVDHWLLVLVVLYCRDHAVDFIHYLVTVQEFPIEGKRSIIFHICETISVESNGFIRPQFLSHTLIGLIVSVNRFRGEAPSHICEVFPIHYMVARLNYELLRTILHLSCFFSRVFVLKRVEWFLLVQHDFAPIEQV